MFRCITELKGLVIDLDSFTDVGIESWGNLSSGCKCLFLVSNETILKNAIECYGRENVYKIEPFRRLFAPNFMTHKQVLSILRLRPTEIAYVSENIAFLNNALRFLGGTIWLTDEVSYEDASQSPDLICRSVADLGYLLRKEVSGFLGESAVYPNDKNAGMIVPLEFDVDGESVLMHMLGRYFGYSHYMSQLHPYSTAIFFNKKAGRNYYKKFDDIFTKLYVRTIKRIQRAESVDGVVSIPGRPGREDRFDSILEAITSQCGIKNYGREFVCVKDYPEQKALSSLERQENIRGAFRCTEELRGKRIVIIDDIITTGSTMREGVRALRAGGADPADIVVLGINQLQGNYWASDIARVACPVCGDKMRLLVNGNTKEFFYSCPSCPCTLEFEAGRDMLSSRVNSEF